MFDLRPEQLINAAITRIYEDGAYRVGQIVAASLYEDPKVFAVEIELFDLEKGEAYFRYDMEFVPQGWKLTQRGHVYILRENQAPQAGFPNDGRTTYIISPRP